MTQTNKHSGYTLIELMVVVAIIGILAAIALPVFTGATNSNSTETIQYEGND